MRIRNLAAMGLLAGIAALAGGVGAATFTVTTTADTPGGVCDVASCTLREAIAAANTNPGADDIDLPAGNYVLAPRTKSCAAVAAGFRCGRRRAGAISCAGGQEPSSARTIANGCCKRGGRWTAIGGASRSARWLHLRRLEARAIPLPAAAVKGETGGAR